ncbi:MAG: hypothetical protein EAZ08_03380 [Cytophagales bacterium]|nr:MAG: hypothetical protein EAZ08_03380 [Cytophagales bacterium]
MCVITLITKQTKEFSTPNNGTKSQRKCKNLVGTYAFFYYRDGKVREFIFGNNRNKTFSN